MTRDAPAGRRRGTRCFIAVALPDDVRTTLVAVSRELDAAWPGVRWVRKPENLHLTLSFLGDVADAPLAAMLASFPTWLADLPAFDLEVHGLGGFPSARRAKVLWAGVPDPTGALARVAARVARGVATAAGIPADGHAERPFQAHVTLGRSPSGIDARAAVERFADRRLGRFPVGAVGFYESRLARAGETGSTYLLRAVAPLSR